MFLLFSKADSMAISRGDKTNLGLGIKRYLDLICPESQAESRFVLSSPCYSNSTLLPPRIIGAIHLTTQRVLATLLSGVGAVVSPKFDISKAQRQPLVQHCGKL